MKGTNKYVEHWDKDKHYFQSHPGLTMNGRKTMVNQNDIGIG